MDFRYLIARRYFVSRKQFSLISVISGISVAGIALGTAVLIVVLSVLNGFFVLVRDLLVSFDPHVRIVSAETRGLSNPDSLIDLVRKLPEVVSAAPYVEGKAQFIWGAGNHPNRVVIVRGISPRLLLGQNQIASRLTFGKVDLQPSESGEAGILLGEALTSRMGIFPVNNDFGPDRVELRSAAAMMKGFSSFGFSDFPKFQVRGLFVIDPTYDATHVFIDLNQAKQLFRMGDRVSGIELRLKDLSESAAVKKQLAAQLDPHQFTVLTWYDLQKTLYDTMMFEKWGASLVLALIILVAAFNIVGSLTMVVIEKRRDLAILQTMGVPKKDIGWIFLLQGLLTGGVGVAIGLTAGLVLCWIQDRFQLVPLFGDGAFIISAYPVAVQSTDVVIISFGVLILCLLAAVYPALRATQTEPVEAIRWS